MTELQIMLPGAVGNLEVLLSSPLKDGSPVAVICHPHPLQGGNLTHKVVTILHKTFCELGYTTLRFNFRGVGESQGSYADGIGECEDLRAVLSWLSQEVPKASLTLAGFSFGTFVVTTVSQDKLLSNLVLVAPAVEHFNFNNLTPKCPWLIIQGEADEVVPPQLVYEWVNSLQGDIKFIRLPNTSHYFHGHLMDIKDQLTRYLAASHDEPT